MISEFDLIIIGRDGLTFHQIERFDGSNLVKLFDLDGFLDLLVDEDQNPCGISYTSVNDDESNLLEAFLDADGDKGNKFSRGNPFEICEIKYELSALELVAYQSFNLEVLFLITRDVKDLVIRKK